MTSTFSDCNHPRPCDSAPYTFPSKIYNIGQYRYKLVISGMLFFHNLEYMVICNCTSFIAMYLHPVRTEIYFCSRHKKCFVQKNIQFIMILPDVRNFWREIIKGLAWGESQGQWMIIILFWNDLHAFPFCRIAASQMRILVPGLQAFIISSSKESSGGKAVE